jgi:ubiquinol-cytochrome c reductase cytochrome c subunit
MPLAAQGAQAQRKQTAYQPEQIQALAAYVASLAPGPAIPVVDLSDGDLQLGGRLFRTNCAQCHNSAGAGGALSHGKFAPALTAATPTQIAEAMRTGPESMPVFGGGQFDDHEVNSIVKYVDFLQHNPQKDLGGAAIGHLGPVPEGLVIWLVGIGGLLVAAMWIGARA